jgi:hypothetical protein
MKRLVLVFILAACNSGGGKGGGGDDSPVLPDGDTNNPPTIDYQSFTTRTRSFGLAGDVHQLALTDTTGPIACGLSTDYHNGLGTAGHVILINVTHAQGTPCTTGTYSVHAGCETGFGQLNPYAVPEGCAYYRRYDAQAKMLGIVAASAGSVQITGNESSCTITTNLSFGGQAYTDTVTLTNGLTAQPWCK